MSVRSNRFVLVFRSRSGEVVHEEAPEFNTLIHDVAFAAVCAGELANDGCWQPIEIEAEWDDDGLAGVRVRVAQSSRAYSRAVFDDRALEIMRTAKLSSAEASDGQADVSWNLEVRGHESEPHRSGRRASVRHRAYPLIRNGALECGPAKPSETDDVVSLSVSEDLVAELREETAHSLDRERADFLIGQLVQHEDDRIAVVLHGRIPADTEGSLVSVAFLPATFRAAQQQLERRGAGGVILGWHHNHPPPCGQSCLMTVPACRTANVMFSFDDRAVHRSAFSRPYMVALVSGKAANQRADEPLIRAYGWRRGRICEKEWTVY